MFPFLRWGRVVAAARTRPPLDPLGDSVVTFRVWPSDVDTNLHLNNGRYLTMMDLGRWDLMVRTGVIPQLVKRRWRPVVGAATIRFRRSIDPFQTYDLRTRIVGWDAKAFYLEQRFERDGEVYATGVTRGVFLSPKGRLSTEEMVSVLAPGAKTPELPRWVQEWAASLETLVEEARAEASAGAPPPGELSAR